MNPHNSCRFCDIINGHYQYINVDEPIAENEEFVAIASIGAIVEGWTLILPKDHQCSMKSFYEKTSLKNISDLLIPKFFSTYGGLVAFEHGANKNGSPTGCGIDHAHLHFVPLKESLLSELFASNLYWIKCHPSKISSLVGKKEYLFYTELKNKKKWQDPLGYLHVLERPASQFFRRLIGKKIGKIEMADYNTFPYLKTAEQTKNTLSEISF